ncbi:MAG: thioredoxin domain-containing protein [Nitrososphaerota archaeon]|nr:thioredoxin domain-containing protein [Nitrososphaerota archaeon]
MTSSANRLADEKSPYLQEHARNPVDWWPWGKEAAAKAKNDGKPIFLSIGYSTCHWCHVMRRESFEDSKTAAFINKNFIPVKVDREERPEVDAYYMSAVQAMTGGGGWPLSVFLTPDLKPFYGGTYFPPERRQGMPSFMEVLTFVSNLWREKREQVIANTEQVVKATSVAPGGPGGELKKGAIDDGYADLLSSFDPDHGGFGTAPKFPLPLALGFMLRYHFRTGKELAKGCVTKTLDEMMAGGIRDHLGGGFHRYSTDRVWLVPHFEKMLYDNALLARAYAEGYQVTGRREYAEVVRETLGWISREMRSPEGGLYSAQDADSAQGEGYYYTWTPQEVAETLGREDGEGFCRAYGVTNTGNFGGRSLLTLSGASHSEKERERLARSKKALYSARLKRARPSTDDKVLTSWNGLAISAFAYAGGALGDRGLVDDAIGAANFVLQKNSRNGRLLRRYAGGQAALAGTLEDYAFFIQGLLDLFEASSEPSWLAEATRLARTMMQDFEDADVGGFFLTVEPDPVRLKESYDGPTPSGNSVAVMDLIRLTELTGDREYAGHAEKTLKAFGREIEGSPTSHVWMLAGEDLLVNGTREVVVTAPMMKEAETMKAEVLRRFAPDRAVITATAKTFPDLAKLSSLLEGREPMSGPRAYVCEGFSCKVPAESIGALAAQLGAR